MFIVANGRNKSARSRPRWKPLPPAPGGSRWPYLETDHYICSMHQLRLLFMSLLLLLVLSLLLLCCNDCTCYCC